MSDPTLVLLLAEVQDLRREVKQLRELLLLLAKQGVTVSVAQVGQGARVGQVAAGSENEQTNGLETGRSTGV